MARIDEIRFLRRSVPQREARLKRELERLGLTISEAWSFRGRIDRIEKERSRLDQMEAWYSQLGDEWAKDDWPHAMHTRVLADGAYKGAANVELDQGLVGILESQACDRGQANA